MKSNINLKNGAVLLSIALAAALFTSCAPNIKNQNSDELAANIVGGRKMSSTFQKQNGIVGIVIVAADGQGICTGSLIARNIILTAAHCLDESQSPIQNIFVVFNDKIIKAKVVRTASTGLSHENFAPSAPETKKSWNDIALLKLSRDAPADFKLALLPSSATEVTLATGLELEQAGFGRSEALRSTKKDSSGVLRAVSGIKIISVSEDGLELLLDETIKGSCNGDSGGPAYAKTARGNVVVGVDSRGTSQTSCIGQGIYTSVVGHLDWINKNMKLLSESSLPAAAAPVAL